MFYLGGVGLAFFLTLLLVSKSKKTFADKILACWLVFITVHLLLFYFDKSGLYPQILGAGMPLPLVHGPFLYLYTRSLTNKELPLWISLIHFLPAIMVLLYLIPFFALPVEQKIYVFENKGIGYELFIQIRLIAIIISGISYIILSSIVLQKHRKSIVDEYSYTDKINLIWMQYLIYWIGVIWFLVIFTNDDWVFIGAVLFILFIGFFGIRHVGIFHSPGNFSPKEMKAIVQIDPTANETMPEKRKYQKSGLSSDSSEALHKQLSDLMASEKVFCETELSLTQLAARMDIQPNYLSQVINEREGKNFYDYINSLRIEEFKRLAANPDSRKYTLLAMAEQCGFNSKSSFNRYFKKVTGQLPSEFLMTVSNSIK